MVNFRRVIMAFAVLALFTGLASADVIVGSTQLTCATNVGVTPALRSEGRTEQTGDITITCTGGPAPVASTPTTLSPVALVNFRIFYNSTVTSRLFSTGPNLSEALLLIDEPGSGLLGDGPNQPQQLCPTPLSGCQAYVSTAAAATAAGRSSFATTNGTTPAPNVYQGIVGGSYVDFLGVPVLAPTTTGSRVFRITNVRIDATLGATQVTSSISITPASALAITQPVTIVGYVNPSLSTSADAGVTIQQCASVTKIGVSTLNFKELFASAFKTRIYAQTDTPYSGQTGLVINPAGSLNATSQSTPGSVFNTNSESNFVFPIGSNYAGLADYGTRLKATFNNIPSGARIFVSTANIGGTVPANIGGNMGNAITTAYVGYAKLVTNETAVDAIGVSGTLSSLDTSATTTSAVGSITITEVPISNGVGTAVWEVLNTNPNTNESFKFGVYITNVANVSGTVPPVSTVNMSYAPTATSGTATTGVLPRFAGSTTTPPIINVAICRTILLYPFVTNQAGFDTGISVANTTMDPFATGPQPGSCKLNWYGGTTATPTVAPAASDTGIIAAGAVYANTVQTMAPTFQGYMIAVCNFQFAHGFAAVSSNYGANNGIFTTYLAVVLTDGRSNGNTTTAENGGN